jgi:PilZ domain
MKPVANAERVQLGENEDRRQNRDRRRSPRRKMLRRGLTFWPNGDSSECIVDNLSETGAQLVLRGPAPNSFDLAVDGEQWRRSCAVVWRKANRVGVEFQEQAPATNLTKSPTQQTADFRRYALECRMLATRAAPSDRELLMEMAAAWTTVVRRLRRKSAEPTN